jgi:hypothetical protein
VIVVPVQYSSAAAPPPSSVNRDQALPRPAPMRSMTTCGTRARGLSRNSIRTTSAQSSGRIISSLERPEYSAIGVSTKPGQSA